MPAFFRALPRRLRHSLAAAVVTAVAAIGLVPLAAGPAHADTVTGPIVGPASKCLDNSGASTTNGNPIVLWPCSGSANQTWTLPGDGTLRVQGKCLDVPGAATTAGTKVDLWDCNASAAQQWVPGSADSLRNPHSNLCLDVTNGSTASGTRIQIWTCNGSAAQSWTLPTGGGGGPGNLAIADVGQQTATVGVASGLRSSASGGSAPYQWAATVLPAGLSMNYVNGTILGAPKQAGSSTASITVTDATGATATKTFTWVVNAATTAASWYLDCSAATNGDGSQASPWNSLASANARTFAAGERLLLKRGATCNGQLAPRGSGTAAAPIILDAYGSGGSPVIAGGGLVKAATVQLTNQSYWIVQNLEVTNDAATDARRSGIVVTVTDGQQHAGITIRNNNVHDVRGWTNRAADLNSFYLSHGIGVELPNDGGFIKGLTISGNYVHEIRGNGIGLYGNQENGHNNNAVRNQFVHVADNTVKNISQDGIVVCVSDSPLIEHNVADQLGWQHNDGVYAGIWSWAATDPTYQFNEVSNISVLTDDSVAWDCDGYIKGTCTYQYNYDHDNANGILLTCASCGGSEATKVVFRYNVSVNDCRLHNYTGTLASFDFYGNTVDCRNKNWDFGEVPALTRFSNNIFIGKAGSSLPSGPTYRANVYVGFNPPSDPQASTADPKLVAATGTGSYGINTIGGYQLLTGSPALGTGTAVAGNRGRDLWGNAVNSAAPNRGAYAGTGLVTPARSDDSAATYTGTWQSTSCAGCFGGSAHTTTADGASAQFTVTGSTISLFGTQNGSSGIATVSIDGGAPIEIDLYTPGATATGQIIYTSPRLSAGSHTVTVARTGRADPRSSGSAITLDSITAAG